MNFPTLSLCMSANDFPHSSQVCLNILSCIVLIWDLSVTLYLKNFPHSWHTKDLVFSSWIFMCLNRYSLSLNALLHISHLNIKIVLIDTVFRDKKLQGTMQNFLPVVFWHCFMNSSHVSLQRLRRWQYFWAGRTGKPNSSVYAVNVLL